MKSGMAVELIGILNIVENLQRFITYIQTVKKAKESVEKLTAELNATIAIFREYAAILQEYAGSAGDISTPEIEKLFESGTVITNYLQDKLKMNVPGERAKNIVRCLAWPLKVKEAKEQIEQLGRYKSDVIAMLQMAASRTMRKEDHDILHWITDLSPMRFLDKTQRSRPPGTNSWFVEGEKFKKYLEGDIRFMWIRGTPGCGKSVLSSTAFKCLESHCKGNPKMVHALFYSSFREAKALHPENAIRSLIKQIVLLSPLDREQSSIIPECVRAFYHSYRPESGRVPTLEKLIELFFQVIQGFTVVYLVADTLRPKTYRGEIVETLLTLLRDERVRLCVASRREPDIENEFMKENPVIVTVEEADVFRDIRLFCAAELDNIKALARFPEMKAECTEKIANRAKGNFQWAKFAIESLKNSRTVRDIRSAVERSGPSMHEKYAEVLGNIESDRDRELARRVMLLLSMARRSLRASELIDAIAVDWEDKCRDGEKQLIDYQILFDICGPLLSISRHDPAGTDASVDNDPYVSLVHMTLCEFFQSTDLEERFPGKRVKDFEIVEHHGHYELARICLTYLRFTDFACGAVGGGPEGIRAKLVRFPFFAYAAKHWTDHFARSCCVVSRKPICEAHEGDATWHYSLFLPEYVGQYQSWLEASHALSSSVPPDRATSSFATQNEHAIYHLAQYPGVRTILQELINRDGIAEATPDRCGHYGSPMQFAAACGNKEVVELFIENKIPDVLGVGSYPSASDAAKDRGYTEIAALMDVHQWIQQVPVSLPIIKVSNTDDEGDSLGEVTTLAPRPRRRRSTLTEDSCTCMCSCCPGGDDDATTTVVGSAYSVATPVSAFECSADPSGNALDAISAWRRLRKLNFYESAIVDIESLARPGSAPV